MLLLCVLAGLLLERYWAEGGSKYRLAYQLFFCPNHLECVLVE